MSSSTKRTKPMRRAAWALLIAALLFPPISTWNSNSAAFDSGRMAGQLLMGVFLVSIVAFAVFRKSSDDTKAKVSLTISILALLYSVYSTIQLANEVSRLRQAASNYSSTLATPTAEQTAPAPPHSLERAKSDRDVIADIINQMALLHQRQTQKIGHLAGRFEKHDLAAVLIPANLVSAASIAESRAHLTEFGNLIGERDSMFASFAKEGEAVLRSSEMRPADKARAFEVFQSNWSRQEKSLSDLSRAERNSIDAVTKILNLAENNLGTLVAKDGNILFQSQEQLSSYQAQMARITRYAKDEERATLELQQLGQEVQGNVERDLKAMQR